MGKFKSNDEVLAVLKSLEGTDTPDSSDNRLADALATSVLDRSAPRGRFAVTKTPRRMLNLSSLSEPASRTLEDENQRDQKLVYFIRDMTSGYIKIGVSNRPVERLGSMTTGSPHEMCLLLCVPGGYRREGALHLQFETKRIRGEWFALTEDDLVGIVHDAVKAMTK